MVYYFSRFAIVFSFYHILYYCFFLWIPNIFYCFKELVIMFLNDYLICCIFKFFFVYLFLFAFYGFCMLLHFFLSSIIFSEFLEFSIINLISFCSYDRELYFIIIIFYFLSFWFYETSFLLQFL